jgi:hypothetical protein
MEVDDLLRQAWKAVEKAGIPKALHEVAFKEAVDILRSGKPLESTKTTVVVKPKKRATPEKQDGEAQPEDAPDEDTFFATLAEESGVPEADLRDILNLAKGRKVQVTPPSRTLGTNETQQAQTVIALVAGARSRGLGEKPIKASAVRDELKRKNCFSSGNFSQYHLGPMKGFNTGSNKEEILTTTKWVDDFKAAVERAHGRKPEKVAE